MILTQKEAIEEIESGTSIKLVCDSGEYEIGPVANFTEDEDDNAEGYMSEVLDNQAYESAHLVIKTSVEHFEKLGETVTLELY
ncbi:hypothetical protein CN918_29330 [Priestia megaterium]|nr:hypothetical protein CN918_29330 [Priestia megaterium]